jgi:AAT family amino acid transporter
VAARLTRFLSYHAAEIAGFTLIPFLVFDDVVPVADLRHAAATPQR